MILRWVKRRFTTAAQMVSLNRGSGRVELVNYKQVTEIVEARQKAAENAPVIVDVRPPAEIEAYGGPIPTAKVIPGTQSSLFGHLHNLMVHS